MNLDEDRPSLRILVVEDNTDIAENIGDYLEAQGHIVDFAMDGIGGLHLVLTQDFDAILLDIMLPGMDGLTFCKKLRQEGGKRTPVLMLTARDTLADKLDGFDAGADDYLVKPFELEELAARIGALIRRADYTVVPILQVGNLRSRIIIAFCLFGTVLGTVYAIAVYISLDLIDDHLVDSRLLEEVEHFNAHHQRYSDFPRPAAPYITSYIDMESMPLFVVDMVSGLSEGIHEVYSDEEEYHLADQVDRSGPEMLPTDLSKNFTNDEVGVLARTLEQAMQRVETFVEREHQFIRDVSHELRTPVTVIKGAVELLKARLRDEEPSISRPLARIERSVVNMENIIETLLWLSREDAAFQLRSPLWI